MKSIFSPTYAQVRHRLLKVIVSIAGTWLVFIVYIALQLPSIQDLENTHTAVASQVYSADGQLLGNYYDEVNREYVKMSRLPQHLVTALVSTEDARFYQHSGIDFIGFVNIFISAAQGRARGGSTLTQQLARNLYDKQVGRERSLLRKVREAMAAIYLERRFTKEEILTHYFNVVAFGGNVYGIQAASKHYFGKSCENLTIAEAATLVGMLKATTAYNPRRNPVLAQKRRNIVLRILAEQNRISKPVADSLSQLPIITATESYQPVWTGAAQHFRAYLRKWLQDWCKKCEVKLPKNGSLECPDLFADGLKIYTTIDVRLQAEAERILSQYTTTQQIKFDNYSGKNPRWQSDNGIIQRAVGQSERRNVLKNSGASEKQIAQSFQTPIPMRLYTPDGTIDTLLSPLDSIRYYAKFIQPALCCIDVRNGRVLAWVGGLDYNFFPYDRVTGLQRPCSLAFSPIVYAAALEQGVEPCATIAGQPLARQFQQSNAVAVTALGQKVGGKKVIDYAYQLGIRSPLKVENELFRGVQDVNLLELTRAYATIASGGKALPPIFISRIEDRYGNILYNAPRESPQALNPETAYILNAFLQSSARATNVYALAKLPSTLALGLKPATGPFNGEGWAIGTTPYHAVGLMFSFSDRAVHFGYDLAANISTPPFAQFIESLYALQELRLDPKRQFIKPKELKNKIDCN